MPEEERNGKGSGMHMPVKPSNMDTIEFDDNFTDWFDYRGRRKNRSLFVACQKRRFCDSFVSPHHGDSSLLFDCNTNVAAGVNGPPTVPGAATTPAPETAPADLNKRENWHLLLYNVVCGDVQVHDYTTKK